MSVLHLNKKLKEAVFTQDVKLVDALLQSGADATIRVNKDAGNLLHHTTNSHIAKLLIEKGANVDARNRYRLTPLLLAVKQNNVKLARTFLFHNASTSCRDMHGKHTPLHIAVLYNNFQLTTLLLDYGSDINDHENTFLCTPLQLALQMKYVNKDIVQLLMERGADINFINYEKETPLHIAVKNTHCPADIVEMLLRNKADIHYVDSKKNSTLHYAVYSGDAEKVTLLLNKGANIFSYNCKGSNALHSALNSDGNIEIVKVLLEHSNKIVPVCNSEKSSLLAVEKYTNIPNEYKLTPLQLVLQHHLSWIDINVINLLLKYGAEIFIYDLEILYSLVTQKFPPEKNINQENFDENCLIRNDKNDTGFLEKVVKLIVKRSVLNPNLQSSLSKFDEFLYIKQYINQCENEISLIKKELDSISLFKLVESQETLCKLSSNLVYQILQIYIDNTYPIYRDILISKIQRSDLLTVLHNEKLFAGDDDNIIFLDWASITNLVKYLNYTDLFNLFIAFWKCF